VPLLLGQFPQISQQLRGLHVVLGWQRCRIIHEMPFHMSLAWFLIASVWLCALVARFGSGDWNMALAFAQVIAASFSILISYLGKQRGNQKPQDMSS